MSFVSDVVGSLTGSTQAKASRDAASEQSRGTERAAQIQAQSTKDVLAANKESELRSRADLAPFRQAGADVLPSLQMDLEGIRGLVTDPTKQQEFVQDNPFFKALADDAQRRLFNNQAARGKLGSGGTAEALQNSILLLGTDLVNQNVSQRQGVLNSNLNIAQLGANAAAGQANVSQGASNTAANVASSGATNIANLTTAGADARAAGIVGAANARAGAVNNAVNTGLGIAGLFLSDINFKTDVNYVGNVADVPFYFFKYKGSSKLEFGTMAHQVPHINFGGKKYVDYNNIGL